MCKTTDLIDILSFLNAHFTHVAYILPQRSPKNPRCVTTKELYELVNDTATFLDLYNYEGDIANYVTSEGNVADPEAIQIIRCITSRLLTEGDIIQPISERLDNLGIYTTGYNEPQTRDWHTGPYPTPKELSKAWAKHMATEAYVLYDVLPINLDEPYLDILPALTDVLRFVVKIASHASYLNNSKSASTIPCEETTAFGEVLWGARVIFNDDGTLNLDGDSGAKLIDVFNGITKRLKEELPTSVFADLHIMDKLNLIGINHLWDHKVEPLHATPPISISAIIDAWDEFVDDHMALRLGALTTDN